MRTFLPLLLLAFSLPALAHPGHGTDSFQAESGKGQQQLAPAPGRKYARTG